MAQQYQEGRCFCYEGQKYYTLGVPIETTKICTLGGKMIKAIAVTTQYDASDELEVIMIPFDSFERYAIPINLYSGDKIVAVLNGEVVAEYEVDNIYLNDENLPVACCKSLTNIDDVIVYSETINQINGVLETYEGAIADATYYYEQPDVAKRAYNINLVKEMKDILTSAIARVNNINSETTPYDLQESNKTLQQTLDIIYKKYGV